MDLQKWYALWNFSLFLHFSCENELIPMKILYNSCEILAFQTGSPEKQVAHETKLHQFYGTKLTTLLAAKVECAQELKMHRKSKD